MAGVSTEPAGEGKHLDQRFAAFQLVNTGLVDRADHRDRLTAEVADSHRYARFADVESQPFNELGFQLFKSPARHPNPSNQRQTYETPQVDPQRFSGDLLGLNSLHRNLVART